MAVLSRGTIPGVGLLRLVDPYLRFPAGTVEDNGQPYVMRGLEIATGWVLGWAPGIRSLRPVPDNRRELLTILEDSLVPWLARPPCLVAFSGGRDSSGILAAAVGAARRHGLPQPVAATNRFTGLPEVDESVWQRQVIDHLGVKEWVRLEVDDELDIVGPVAGPLLHRYGVLWPANAHFLFPLMQRAETGTLLTGVGGDELFIPSATRAAYVLSGRARPRRRDIVAVSAALAPRMVRRPFAQRHVQRLPWLRPVAAEAAAAAVARQKVGEPLWWSTSVLDTWWRTRYRVAVEKSLQAIAPPGTTVVHPFMGAEFLQAIARVGGRLGFTSRDAVMDMVFGERLPTQVRHRNDKAAFFRPFINRHSRAFIAEWDGTGLDHRVVDADALRVTWGADRVDARSYAALQSAWLAGHGGR